MRLVGKLVHPSAKALEVHSVLRHPLVAHSDGKLLLDNQGVNAARLAVVVFGKGIEKLLAIPKLPGPGILMGSKVVEILRQWEGVPEWFVH